MSPTHAPPQSTRLRCVRFRAPRPALHLLVLALSGWRHRRNLSAKPQEQFERGCDRARRRRDRKPRPAIRLSARSPDRRAVARSRRRACLADRRRARSRCEAAMRTFVVTLRTHDARAYRRLAMMLKSALRLHQLRAVSVSEHTTARASRRSPAPATGRTHGRRTGDLKMDMTQYAGRGFIGVDDVADRPIRGVIAAVEPGQFQQARNHPCQWAAVLAQRHQHANPDRGVRSLVRRLDRRNHRALCRHHTVQGRRPGQRAGAADCPQGRREEAGGAEAEKQLDMDDDIPF